MNHLPTSCQSTTEWQIPRRTISPFKTIVHVDDQDTSNPFSAIDPQHDPMSEGHTTSEDGDNEEIKDFPNDLFDEPNSLRTGKKARGRPKKGNEK